MADQFDNWLKNSAPEVPDSKLDKKILRAILNERIRSMKAQRTRMRRRIGVYSAVMVLVLLISGEVVEVGSDGFEADLVKTVEVPSASGLGDDYNLFEPKFTGGRVGARSGTADDVRNTMEIALGGVSAPRSVTRWAFAGGWRWILNYYDPERNIWVGATPAGVQNKSNEVFAKFMIFESEKYSLLLEQGKATQVGSFVKTIEGIEYEFKMWEITTEDSSIVEIWEGEPVR